MKAVDSSSKPLLIVQDAELNRHVDSFVPMTREKRRYLMRLFLPVFVLLFVLSAELIIIRVWTDGENLADHLPKILGTPIALSAFAFLGMLWQFRILQRTKRTLRLDNMGLVLNGNKIGRVRWERFLSWTLEPVLSEPGLQKLTLRHARIKKGREFSWSLVLKQPEQTDALNAYIEYLHGTGVNVPAIIKQTAMTPKEATKYRSSLHVCLAVVSGLLIINGVYLLAGASFISDGRSPAAAARNRPDTPPNELERIVVRHFSSPREFRQFLLFTGGGLTLLGGFLLIYQEYSRRKASVGENE